jgi:K+-transporting ATPase ATPase C chain
MTPAAAAFQIHRVASERKTSETDIASLVGEHTKGRTSGLLGEPRVNVLELNLALDAKYTARK